MSCKELRRAGVMARVESGELKLVNAAVIMGLSYRQTKRLGQRYREEGAEGLKHRTAGRESNRKKSKKFRERVLRLVGKKYSGEEGERFGPTLAAEHLASEDDVEVNAQTLRRWMLEAGLWSPARKRRLHRKRRERKEHVGELVQMDGSFHDWFEGRGPEGCLMNMVDDASGDTLARMGGEETIWAAAGVLRAWIQKHGIPVALYTDWKNVYVREASAKEQLQGVVPVTQFGQMCQRLGIRIIAAHSPQAKGRVERNHGTHQDRLVKKMRRKKIQTYAEANRFLEKEYLPEHNRRFTRIPAQPEDYHRPPPRAAELDEVFHLETARVIGNDWVVRHDNRYFQVKAQSQRYAPAKARVTVCEWEDGRLQIRYRGRAVAWEEIPAPVPSRAVRPAEATARKHKPPTPKADHPWRQDYRKMRPWSKPGIPVAPAISMAAPSTSPYSGPRNLDHPISVVRANWRAAEEQRLEARRRKAVEKPLRGKVQKTDFPTSLGNPHTPRISTFHTASAATGI
jgi:transposase